MLMVEQKKRNPAMNTEEDNRTIYKHHKTGLKRRMETRGLHWLNKRKSQGKNSRRAEENPNKQAESRIMIKRISGVFRHIKPT